MSQSPAQASEKPRTLDALRSTLDAVIDLQRSFEYRTARRLLFALRRPLANTRLAGQVLGSATNRSTSLWAEVRPSRLTSALMPYLQHGPAGMGMGRSLARCRGTSPISCTSPVHQAGTPRIVSAGGTRTHLGNAASSTRNATPKRNVKCARQAAILHREAPRRANLATLGRSKGTRAVRRVSHVRSILGRATRAVPP